MLELLRKFLTYVITGGTAAVVDFASFFVLERSGADLVLAAVLSFGLGTIFNYVLTSIYVFRLKPTPRRYFGFLGGALIGACVNVGITIFAARLFGVSPVMAKTTGLALAFVVNFTLNILVVFRVPPTAR
jgi:putative flippase GtrA